MGIEVSKNRKDFSDNEKRLEELAKEKPAMMSDEKLRKFENERARLEAANRKLYGEFQDDAFGRNPEQSRALELEAKTNQLRQSYAQELLEILNSVEDIAEMIGKIPPEERQKVYEHGPLPENFFGKWIGNYDTKKGEEMLDKLIDQVGFMGRRRKDRPRLEDIRHRIWNLRRDFADRERMLKMSDANS